MLRASLCLVVAGMILLGAGCKGFDDTQEQSEYEKLRNYPNTPQGDRILPSFENKVPPEEDNPFALQFRISPVLGASCFPNRA
jgi:hypothetical protein